MKNVYFTITGLNYRYGSDFLKKGMKVKTTTGTSVKFKKLKKDGVSEDEAKDAEQTVHKTHEDFIKKVDSVIDAKEKELMTV